MLSMLEQGFTYICKSQTINMNSTTDSMVASNISLLDNDRYSDEVLNTETCKSEMV